MGLLTGKNMLKLSQRSMRNILSNKLSSMLTSDDITVTDIWQEDGTQNFEIEFMPTNEVIEANLKRKAEEMARAAEAKINEAKPQPVKKEKVQ